MNPGEPARPVSGSVLGALLAQRAEFLGFARARLRSDADADDVLQQAFIKAAAHAAELRESERSTAWFYRILRNTLADHHVAMARRDDGLRALALEAVEAPPAEAAACACSLGVLERLAPDYARVVRRIDLDEAPLAEVASELGSTPNATKVRLHRARNALRSALLDHCGVDSLQKCLHCGCD